MKLIITILIVTISAIPFVAAAQLDEEITDTEVVRVAQFNPFMNKDKKEAAEVDEEGAEEIDEAEEETEEDAEIDDEEDAPEDVMTPAEEDEEEEDVLPPIADDFIDDVIPEKKPVVAGPKKVTIDTVVYVDYQFFDSPDAFKVKYHINMGGNANLAAAVIRGSAEIATEVSGFLAKWPQGQCMLSVSIAKVPYEIKYNQTGTDEVDLSINFKRDITERWESNCTFMGIRAKPFKTEGTAEKWIAEALKKSIPPISSIVAPIEAGESTSTTFDISEYTIIEEDLGSAKVKGTGIITIAPATKPGSKGPAGPTSGNFGRPRPSSPRHIFPSPMAKPRTPQQLSKRQRR
jgi:hypothetical protein